MSEPLGGTGKRMTERTIPALLYPLLEGSQSWVAHATCFADYDEITFPHFHCPVFPELRHTYLGDQVEEGLELLSLGCSQNHYSSQLFRPSLLSDLDRSLFPCGVRDLHPQDVSVSASGALAGEFQGQCGPATLPLKTAAAPVAFRTRGDCKEHLPCARRARWTFWLSFCLDAQQLCWGQYCFLWAVAVTEAQSSEGLPSRLWVHPEHLAVPFWATEGRPFMPGPRVPLPLRFSSGFPSHITFLCSLLWRRVFGNENLKNKQTEDLSLHL